MNTVIEPWNLGPGEGFVITGDGDFHFKVSSLGDVNADGFDDFILSGRFWNEGGGNYYDSYVIFGRADAFSDFDHADFGPADGFLIFNGGRQFEGQSAAAAGDVNGDGIDDFIIGSEDDGATVIFGSTAGFSSIDFANPGASGFRIVGNSAGDTGFSVSSAGDVNNDGFDDLIVGAPSTSSSGTRSGEAYVIFGHGGGFGTVNVAALQSAGFRITGDDDYDEAGHSVSSAGDINADGFDDVIVGAPGGVDGVIFGTDAGFANLDLTNLGDAGFVFLLPGNLVGASAASAGDINGDGIDDLIIGGPLLANQRGRVHVVFGHEGDFEDIDPKNLGSAGFTITASDYVHFGWSVSSAGDFNGDGFDDLLIGASGIPADGQDSSVFLVFGHAGGFPDIDVSDLHQLGLQIVGNEGERIVRSVAAGDINGDGFDDLIVGALNANDGLNRTYVIYGHSSYVGPDGADTVEGDSDADRIHGIGGNDLLYGYGGNDVITSGSGDDTAYGHDGTDSLSGDDGADWLYGGLLNDTLDGGAGDDVLNGQDGNDTVDGGAGNDTMRGGTGNDSFAVDSAADKVIEAAGEGTDSVTAEVDYVLTDNVENLTLSGAARSGTGNALANAIDGSAGADTLVGLAGNDSLLGYGGDDTVEGGNGADLLYGHDGLDLLLGGAGNDSAYGGLLRDTLYGDDGDDLVNGQDGNDVIYGGAGNDNVIGGAGNDTMRGETGDDRYSVDSTGDKVFEQANEGADLVTASIDYVLPDNVESLVLAGPARIGTGNTLANVLEGSGGNDTLSGLDGNDTLRGHSGGDRLLGGAGDDVLDGGAGRDVMTGGAGRDLYVFDDGDMQAIRDLADRILDFDQSANEKVRLNLVDADTTLAGDQAFSFLGSAAFTATAGELRTYSLADGYTYIEADTDGDAAPDWYIALTGTIGLSAGDFVL